MADPMDQTELTLAVLNSIDGTTKLIFKNLVLINGGAAIAILAFAGNVLSHQNQTLITKVATLGPALSDFSWGVALAVAAMVVSYFSTKSGFEYYVSMVNTLPTQARLHKTYKFTFVTVLLLSLGSLAFFVWGLATSQSAITAFAK